MQAIAAEETKPHRDACNKEFQHVDINSIESMRNKIEKQQRERLQNVLDGYGKDFIEMNLIQHYQVQNTLIDTAMHFVVEILKDNHSDDHSGRKIRLLPKKKRTAVDLCVIWRELCEKIVLEFEEYKLRGKLTFFSLQISLETDLVLPILKIFVLN